MTISAPVMWRAESGAGLGPVAPGKGAPQGRRVDETGVDRVDPDLVAQAYASSATAFVIMRIAPFDPQ
jgi:hypothetical protein